MADFLLIKDPSVSGKYQKCGIEVCHVITGVLLRHCFRRRDP